MKTKENWFFPVSQHTHIWKWNYLTQLCVTRWWSCAWSVKHSKGTWWYRVSMKRYQLILDGTVEWSGARGDICPRRQGRRQCKTFASGVNSSRNNAIYNINESTKSIYTDFISKTVDILLISTFITKLMPKLLIFDAFTFSICEKNVANYALLRCKAFSLKIWLCKILDK